jgi:hypothetical protein
VIASEVAKGALMSCTVVDIDEPTRQCMAYCQSHACTSATVEIAKAASFIRVGPSALLNCGTGWADCGARSSPSEKLSGDC